MQKDNAQSIKDSAQCIKIHFNIGTLYIYTFCTSKVIVLLFSTCPHLTINFI